MKPIIQIIIAIIFLVIAFFVLPWLFGWNDARGVEMSASVQPNPCNACLEACQ